MQPEAPPGDSRQEVGGDRRSCVEQEGPLGQGPCYNFQLERPSKSGLFPDFANHNLKIPNKQRGKVLHAKLQFSLKRK